MKTIPFSGLHESQVIDLRKTHGPNVLPSDRKASFDVILSVLKEPMLLLLLGAAIIYLLIGDASEAILLLASALLVVSINVIQDFRSTRALQSLKELTNSRARVMRDGVERLIPTSEIVPGDILLLSEGDRIGADAMVLSSSSLLVDESLLTGESVPVSKNSSENVEAEGSRLLSGTLIVRGTAVSRVVATGVHTEIGKIGSALATLVEIKTPLQIQTGVIVRKLAIAGLTCCVVVTVVYHFMRGGWIAPILSGIALAIALLPEEFPVILSVFLALGARTLSKAGILIRRMPAVEALGTVTTLCVDKTGTITKNEMSLLELYTRDGNLHPLAQADDMSSIELLQSAARSSPSATFDPMDRAVFAALDRLRIELPAAELIEQIPISPERPAMIQIWRSGGRVEVAIKGAPEFVLALSPGSTPEKEVLYSVIQDMAKRGLRVLAVARATSERLEASFDQYSFQFMGLLAFADPLREGIAKAIKDCYAAGVRVVMITGDHPETARAIASQAGIIHSEVVISGNELSQASDENVQSLLRANVFARVVPTQKLRIVQLLQAAGEIVVMTGDGVNDAPALKAANIGVAMGGRGTDVARESAAVILTHDDFASLVQAIRLGRRTYDNIKKAMYYVIAVHIPIAGLSFLALFLGLPLILYPVHIVLLELLLDPMSTLVFESESEEKNVMERPPRDPTAPIFQRSALTIATLQGVSILIVCSTVYFVALRVSDVEARTLTFVTLMLSNFCLALVNRSWSKTFISTLRTPNRALWWVISVGMVVVVVITQWPLSSNPFHFGPFHLHDWVICGAAAIFSLTWFEILKLTTKRPLQL